MNDVYSGGFVRDSTTGALVVAGKNGASVVGAAAPLKVTDLNPGTVSVPGEYMAHRGGLGTDVTPENTFEGQEVGHQAGMRVMDGGDIQPVGPISQGMLVSLHDTGFDAYTDGTGAIGQHTMASFRRLHADPNNWVPPHQGWGNDLRMVAFEDYLRLLKQYGNCVIVPECKGQGDGYTAQKMVALIQKFGVEKSIIFASFNNGDIAVAKAAGLRTMLYASTAQTLIELASIGPYYYGYDYTQGSMTAVHLQQVYDSGIKLSPWIVTRRNLLDAHIALVQRPLAIVQSDDARWTGQMDVPRTQDVFPTGLHASGTSPRLAGALSFALYTALTGTNNDLVFRGPIDGTVAARGVTIQYVVSGNSTALSVTVSGKAITVNVATSAGGAATSTATQVRDAVNASAAVQALGVTATLQAGNDGTGVVTALAATPLIGRHGFKTSVNGGGTRKVTLGPLSSLNPQTSITFKLDVETLSVDDPYFFLNFWADTDVENSTTNGNCYRLRFAPKTGTFRLQRGTTLLGAQLDTTDVAAFQQVPFSITRPGTGAGGNDIVLTRTDTGETMTRNDASPFTRRGYMEMGITQGSDDAFEVHAHSFTVVQT